LRGLAVLDAVHTMDYWDPALVTALARERRLIVFDSLGIGETGYETPVSVESAADFAAGVLRSLDLGATDILGWSLSLACLKGAHEPRDASHLVAPIGV
jgi:pimeloyl-ACP methyl ester carboxylesterase